MRPFAFALLVVSSVSSPLLAQQPAASAHACAVQHTTPTEGDRQLLRRQYAPALEFYTDAMQKDPESVDARLGLVRALIGLDKVPEAQKAADDTLAKWPKSAIAEVAEGEVAYRAADFEGMRHHASLALQDDNCEGRANALAATFWIINARFATAARDLGMAHKLRPDDELIRRRWMSMLSRDQRADELEKSLHGTNASSDEAANRVKQQVEKLRTSLTGQCRVTSKSTVTQIPFVPDYDSPGHFTSFGLDISINGAKRHMLIDTGASGIVLFTAAAKKLGLEPEQKIRSGGIGDEGSVNSFVTHVQSIKIGDVELSNCTVDVLEQSHMGGDGLIGLDTFARWLATLDFAHRKLLLNPLPPRNATDTADSMRDDDDGTPHDAITPPEMKDWIHIIRLGHSIMLPSTLEKGPIHYLMMDTRASRGGLSLPFARSGGHVELAENATVTGISGRVDQVYILRQATLYFGHFALPPMDYHAWDMSNMSRNRGVEMSGLIGLPTLAQLTITVDYRDNLMRMDYDPKANH